MMLKRLVLLLVCEVSLYNLGTSTTETCQHPPAIPNGYTVVRQYDCKEKFEYKCHGNYILDGAVEAQCEQTENQKPVCRASCVISVRRGRILYNNQKTWLHDLPERRVQHADRVAFYCKDKDRGCGYPVYTQCLDGNLTIPSCYKEPSSFTYNLNHKNLPSEIQQC
ncbi:beta-2-glycoprotein 1-like [Acipenser ruthenus]|uniref:beta-2-glycoprotein 1-like n=1 Tax=Acipenser ruthenus TaxID=7906 RepID=UPI00145A676E|nr:beta-2-glycoprotein 1-like [Acipenser ruthenus]XP_058848261.1 beta-2-glycoprotein 1-like [Acipenser ruthenus]